jgi:mono/diheme cytochrome c family protein
MKSIIGSAVLIGGLFLTISLINCSGENENKQMTQQELIARGKYLVTTGGCGDCHTPKIYTANGPMMDTTRRGSGFQAGTKLPALDVK